MPAATTNPAENVSQNPKPAIINAAMEQNQASGGQKRPRSPNDNVTQGKEKSAALAPPGQTESAPSNPDGTNPSDEEIASSPRKFGIELLGPWISDISTKRQLAAFVEKAKPQDAIIREVLRTAGGRILIFPEKSRDYNILLKIGRWDPLFSVAAQPAPRGSGGTAIIVNGVDSDITIEEVLDAVRRQGANPSNAHRMKRAVDGAATASVKIFVESESEIEALIKNGVFIHLQRHRTTRYAPPRFLQCYKCQSFGHSTRDCQNQRKCLKCSQDHHHSDCMATKEEYKCGNCGENHISSDNRCAKIKEAISNSRETSATPFSAPSSSNNTRSNAPSTSYAGVVSTRENGATTLAERSLRKKETTFEK